MDELVKKIEAILFSVGDRISVEEISKLTRQKDHDIIKEALIELRKDVTNREGPIMLQQEGNFWKLNVKEEHLPTVRKVVKKMELPKTLLETLASIAWKAPVLQSQIIRIRTNKAYDHLDQLEEMGYISRKKYGRTKMIALSQKFYDYFEINKKGGLGKIFKRVTERAKKKFPESAVVTDEQMTLEEVEAAKKKTPADKELEKLHKKGLIRVGRKEDIEIDAEGESIDAPDESEMSSDDLQEDEKISVESEENSSETVESTDDKSEDIVAEKNEEDDSEKSEINEPDNVAIEEEKSVLDSTDDVVDEESENKK